MARLKLESRALPKDLPMRFAQTFAATLLAGMTLASVAHANLVTNGSFESSNATTDKLVFQNNVTGWGGGAKLTYISPPGTADNGKYLSVYGPFPKTSPDGGNFVLADGDPNYSSAITQTISGLNIGQSYLLTFYQAAGQQAGFKGPTTEQWKVTFGGETQYSTLYTLPQGGVGDWQAQSMTFIATAATQLLSFLAVGTPGGAPPISFLDGVNLEATSVPEPASLALFGSGIVGLCLARRRGRAQAA